MGPWEKLQLGWLDYAVVSRGRGRRRSRSARPRCRSTDQEQAVIIDVPDQGIETDVHRRPTPAATPGGRPAPTTSTRRSPARSTSPASRAPPSPPTAWYDIEAGYDYLYAEYSTDGGATGSQIGAPLDRLVEGQVDDPEATPCRATATVQFRFRFQSDGGVHLANAFLDDIVVKSGGTTLLTDDVESGDNGWTADGGFKISTGTETALGDRYYLVENRTYVGYDVTLEEGPYQFSFAFTRARQGRALPVPGRAARLGGRRDLHRQQHHRASRPRPRAPGRCPAGPFGYEDGIGRPSNRRQPFDATFGLQATDDVTLHKEVLVGHGKNQTIETVDAPAPSNPGIPTFDDGDEDAYYSDDNPLSSTLVAGHGVTVTVTGQTTGSTMTIVVTNPD